VTAYLLDREGGVQPRADRVAVESRLASGDFFWLDLHSPSTEEFDLLRNVLKFHPLALEDSEDFGQRPKVEDYGDFIFVVFYGAAPPPDEDRLVEIHSFYSDRFLVTVRQDEAPACDELRERYSKRPTPAARPIVLLYRLLDSLTDSFFPVLGELDDRIDRVQEAMVTGPSEAEQHEIFDMRRRLVALRRVVTPQRDLIAELASGVRAVPDMDEEAERYFRDVYDHLVRVSETIDSYRDLLTSAMDVYLSTVSNRLNTVTARLTIISTILLPLIVLTSFFGQNFGWLVDKVGGLAAFLVLGVALPLIAVVLLVLLLRRQRLL
jgi:magnesium transporter